MKPPLHRQQRLAATTERGKEDQVCLVRDTCLVSPRTDDARERPAAHAVPYRTATRTDLDEPVRIILETKNVNRGHDLRDTIEKRSHSDMSWFLLNPDTRFAWHS
jgi:hypothetical protein